jgi:nucleotide-binding universal stress UspA family protein
MSRFQTILMPTDLSQRSLYALPVARSLARTLHARLVVLFVMDDFPAAEIASGLEARSKQAHREALLERLRGLAPCGPGLAVDHEVREGVPSDEILRLAREQPCDLIVMSTHGRTGLERLLMGSVAETVVRGAPCPVMTVRRPVEQAENPPAATKRSVPA